MVTRKQRFWSRLESISELDTTQRYFLTMVAQRESKYNPAAHNGRASERLAASKALENNVGILELALTCGVNAERLRSGSWGLFQRLAPYWADDMRDIFGASSCSLIDPSQQVKNINLQIVDAIRVAHRLQQYPGWKAYPTAGNLRLGWLSFGLMGYISENEERLQRYREDAFAAKIKGETGKYPSPLVDGTIREFPTDYKGIYTRLGGAG